MMEFILGDYINFEFGDDQTGEPGWLWLRVDYYDNLKKLIFGWLNSEPVVFNNES
jgi:hypothetical protein